MEKDDKMFSAILKYWQLIAVGVALTGGLFVARDRMMRLEADVAENRAKVEDRIRTLDAAGSAYAQSIKWVVEQHSGDIRDLKADTRAQAAASAEMRSSIAVINSKLDTIIKAVETRNGKP